MSILDQIFFSKASRLIDISKTEVIDESHNIEMPSSISAYRSNWDEKNIDWSSNRRIYFSLIKSSGKLFWLCVLYQVLASLCSFSTPFFIHQFMTLLQSLNEGKDVWSDSNIQTLILLALGLGFSGAGHGLIIQHYFYGTLNFFQISNNIINKKIYDHALKISQVTKQKNQIGEIVNLMSSDADAIGDISITTIDLGNAIVLLVGCSAMLFYYIGWSALVAIVVMITLVPLTKNLAKKFTSLESDLLKFRDQRMSIMAQILNAIRVIKYFSWEKSVYNEVSEVRRKEIESRIKLNKSEILWGLLYVSISTVVLFVALFTHYLRGHTVDLPLVLTCISIFAVMEDQFGGLSRFISRFINIFVSGQRVSDFLKSDTISEIESAVVNNSENKINLKNIYFSYSPENSLFVDFNLDIQKGECIAVVGPVASGKSSLLNLILNEYAVQKGSISVPKNWVVAYQSQDPFILNATLRENIIFGSKDISEEKLNKALEITSLVFDIKLLPYGLDTEIGEKGVNLSGGQKQRVCLARCLLANPDLVLMDDPLSAVDVHTEAELCDKLIFGEWKSKTQIMTTHRIGHLKRFDRIVFLNYQKTQIGTFDELMKSSEEFRNFIFIESENQKNELAIKKSDLAIQVQTGLSDSARITVDEDRAIGSVEKSVYTSYISSLGGRGRFHKLILFFVFFSAIVAVFAPLVQKTWLTKYNHSYDTQIIVLGYGILGLLTMVIYYFNNLFWMWRGIKSGIYFHDKTLDSILKSDIRFFDSTPIGRILQRFSRDVESVDVQIQWTFEQTMNALLQVGLSFFLIVITLPLTIIFLIPVIIYYYQLQKKYRRVAREVKRLDSLARSPKYSHFKETLQGISVIRAFKREPYFNSEFLLKLEKSTQAFYNHLCVNRWFSTRLPLLGALISTVTVLSIIFSSYKGWISAGVAGLITLYALQFWRYLNWGIRIFSDLETRMTSIERLNFYQDLDSEKIFENEQPLLVPQTGRLEFRHVTLKYAEHLPVVLKDVSFIIPSGAKVGIVGRTGSGKSTLFQAVYRFVHYSEGDILIDGHSIRSYSLFNLRRALAVIPQDPTLFMGSLRGNLDRYNEKSDGEIFAVLEKVGLLKYVQSLPEKLNHQVSENGSNLSQGQRQLICLARALLMKVKIIFLDEATASVDVETDALVQNVIQGSLGGITLVTIAHRLSTLKGYDQIIELDQGRVIS